MVRLDRPGGDLGIDEEDDDDDDDDDVEYDANGLRRNNRGRALYDTPSEEGDDDDDAADSEDEYDSDEYRERGERGGGGGGSGGRHLLAIMDGPGGDNDCLAPIHNAGGNRMCDAVELYKPEDCSDPSAAAEGLSDCDMCSPRAWRGLEPGVIGGDGSSPAYTALLKSLARRYPKCRGRLLSSFFYCLFVLLLLLFYSFPSLFCTVFPTLRVSSRWRLRRPVLGWAGQG